MTNTDPTTPATDAAPGSVVISRDVQHQIDIALIALRNRIDRDQQRGWWESINNLINALAAAERPAEGDTVTIHTGEIPKGEQWIIHGRVIAKLHISTGLDAVDAALAASSAPADAALGQGEGK